MLHLIPEESKFLTKEKAYILGTLCGDGYIRIQNSSQSYLIGLDVCDEDFADKFKKCLENVYFLSPSKKLKNRKRTNVCKNPRPQHVINLTSKLAVLDLLNYSPSFKTKEWVVPPEIINSTLEIKSEFIKGLFDSEGSIRLKKKGHSELIICSGNKGSLLFLKWMLKKDFDIDMKIRQITKKNKILRIYTERYKEIKKFHDHIGFSIKRKQDTLKSCLKSYKRKGLRSYNSEFKQKVLNLLEEGYSAYQIGKILDFPHTNVYDFIKQKEKGKF